MYEQIFEPRRVEGTEWTGGIVRRETRTRETRVASEILELFSRCCHSILLHIGGVTLLESERDFDGREIDCISAVVVAFFLRFDRRDYSALLLTIYRGKSVKIRAKIYTCNRPESL